MNGQAIIVFIILLICVLWAGYKLFRMLRNDRTKRDEKCGDCAYKTFCHDRKSGG